MSEGDQIFGIKTVDFEESKQKEREGEREREREREIREK